MKHVLRSLSARARVACASLPLLLLCVTAAFAPARVGAQNVALTAELVPPYRISYRLSMSQPLTHLFEVEMEIETAGREEFVELQMPRWSPGRYGVFEFAKNVQEFGLVESQPATGKSCAAPRVVRMDTQTWRVRTCGERRLRVAYKVFGDDLSGTFSQLDSRHANFNGGSVFMYVVGHKPDPVRLAIEPPAGWRIVNGYTTRPDQREWEFPNYDVMIDAPTEIAPDFTVDEFRVGGKLYRVVVHSFGAEGGKRAALVRDIEKIVKAETSMMGAPEFDAYTFLIHFDPTATRGDGMEHLTSTQLVETGALADEGRFDGTLEAAAHEFFHVWNVKRLRPVGLGPWDFTRPVATRGLWIAEGFTNYYGNVALRRAGFWSDEEFLNACADTITGIERSPGSRLMSAEDASLLAPMLDRAFPGQRTNLSNTSISYYPKGEVLGLVLDLLIRGRSRGRVTLDDVMRRAYEEFYLRSRKDSYYLRGRAYTNEEFARVASQVAGTSLEDFFTRYARGTETPPYDEAFAYVGLRLVRSLSARDPFNAGLGFESRDGRTPIVSNVRTGSPAERAGLRQGDALVSVGSTNVTLSNLRETLRTFKQGDHVPLTLQRGRETVKTELVLDAPDNYTYHLEEIKDASPEARALRAAWLDGGK